MSRIYHVWKQQRKGLVTDDIRGAHPTAWPRPSGACCRVKLIAPAFRQHVLERFQFNRLAALAQCLLKFDLYVEISSITPLLRPVTKMKCLNTGCHGFLDHHTGRPA